MSLKSEYVSMAEADEPSASMAFTPGDRRIVREVCRMVSTRAARISAAAMAAVITKMDPSLSRKHTIAIDGSVYEKHPGFSANIRSALKELFGPKASRIRLVLSKDGSGKGAAIIAAVAAKSVC
jgi:hexokinase